MKNKGIWKKILFVILSLLVLGLVAILDPNVKDIATVMTNITPGWFGLAILSMLLYYVLDTVMYLLACRYMEIPQGWKDGLLTTMLGFFYSALTPFQSGGQPMQVLQMRRRGITVGASTSVLILKFLAWQIVVTVLGTAGFVFLGGDVLDGGAAMLVLFILGYLINAGCIVLALLAFLKPKWIFAIGERLLDFLHRHKLIKKQEMLERSHATWKNTIIDYELAVRFALRHTRGMLMILLCAAAEAMAYMMVTYFIYRGLGFNEHPFYYVVLLQGLLYIAVSFIPLPGASIASEGGFYMVFSKLFTPAARFPAMLLWRAITYYGTIVLGLVAVIVDGFRPDVRKPAQAGANALPDTQARERGEE